MQPLRPILASRVHLHDVTIRPLTTFWHRRNKLGVDIRAFNALCAEFNAGEIDIPRIELARLRVRTLMDVSAFNADLARALLTDEWVLRSGRRRLLEPHHAQTTP